jgi:hypothetical protein
VAVNKYTPAWLADAIESDPALRTALYRVAWSDKATRKFNETTREWAERACLDFFLTYENFSKWRERALTELHLRQAQRDARTAEADEAESRWRQELHRVWVRIYAHECVDRRRAALYAEQRLKLARMSARMAGYLARESHPLNAALRQLTMIESGSDSDVAELATALLKYAAKKIGGETPVIKASRVREIRRPLRRRKPRLKSQETGAKPRGIRSPNNR